jgi:glutamine synthetase
MQPARDVLDGRNSKTEVYSVDHLHGMLPLFSDIYAGAKAAGITAETLISEYAPGQYELTLHYRTDVMQAADDLMRLKRIVRAQARAHGVTACFMAKPNENYAGSGMHFHVSCWTTRAGTSLSRPARGPVEPDHPARPGRAEADHGRIDAGLCAPRQFLAPLRSAKAMRRSARPGASTTARSRCAFRRATSRRGGSNTARRGVDANPYLVAATVLAGIRKGCAKASTRGPEDHRQRL